MSTRWRSAAPADPTRSRRPTRPSGNAPRIAVMSTLEDYVAKAQAALDGLRPQLDELRVQADLAQAEARDRLQAGIAALQKAQTAAKTQLDQAARAGKDSWKSTAR